MKFTTKQDGIIGINEEDIALIYKYGIIFLDGTEIQCSQTKIRRYMQDNDLHHLYCHDICG